MGKWCVVRVGICTSLVGENASDQTTIIVSVQEEELNAIGEETSLQILEKSQRSVRVSDWVFILPIK